MSVAPNLTHRSSRQVELVLPHRRDLLAFEIGAAHNLDTAFAGSTAMFRVISGGSFRSRSIRRRRLGLTQESTRGLSRVVYDPEDFWTAGGTLPHDADISFLRAAEVAPDGTAKPEGPILVVPPPGFFSSPRPALSVQGTAPSVTLTTTRLPPDDAMHIVLPKFADNLHLRNLSATDPLLFSFSKGQPLISLGVSAIDTLYDAAFKEIFLCGDGATVDFDARFAIVNGEMA
jgi:hypothetical protein